MRIVVRSGTLDYLLDGLESHRLDVVLSNHVPARDAATRWNAHTIDRQPVALIAAPGIGNPELSVVELLSRYPIAVPTRESSMRVEFDALVDRLELHPRLLAEVDDMALLRLMARQARSLVLVPPIVVADELESGELHVLANLPGCFETFSALRVERQFPNELLRELFITPSGN